MPSRILRDGILTSVRVNALSADEEVFYRRLMSAADDYGRFYALPGLLIAACYPLRIKTVTEKSIEKWIAALVRVGLVVVYQVKTTSYIQMLDFRQQVRAKKSKYPNPDEGEMMIAAQPEQISKESTARKKAIDPAWIPSETTVFRLTEEFKFRNGDAQKYLEYFRSYCLANGKSYTDYDQAFSNCVRADWPKLRNGKDTMPNDPTLTSGGHRRAAVG